MLTSCSINHVNVQLYFINTPCSCSCVPHRQKQSFEVRYFVSGLHPVAVPVKKQKENLSAFTGQDRCAPPGVQN